MKILKWFGLVLLLVVVTLLVLAQENRVFGRGLSEWFSWEGVVFTFIPIAIGAAYIISAFFNGTRQKRDESEED
jgi:hypothetical protein